MFAMEGGGKESDRAQAQHVGQEDRQVGARAAEPAAEGFAQQRGLGTHLHHVEEGAVGPQDGALVVDDHEGVRPPFEQVLGGDHLGTALVEGRGHAGRGELNQEHLVRGGGHQGCPRQPGLPVLAEPQQDARGLAALAHLPQHVGEGLAILDQEGFQKLAGPRGPGLGRGQPQGLGGGGIQLQDAQAPGIQDEDGLVGGVEEEPIAGLDLAQLPVVPLQGLLGLDQPILEFGDGAQVLAHRQQAPVLAQLDGGVFDVGLGAAGQALHDLAEGGNTQRPGILEHELEVNPIRWPDGVGPRPSHPVIGMFARESIRQAGFLDDAIDVQHKLDVRRCNAFLDHRTLRLVSPKDSC